jgi:hypothetical protein
MSLMVRTVAFFLATLSMASLTCTGKNEPAQLLEAKNANDSQVHPSKQEHACVPKLDDFPEPEQTSAVTGACENTAASNYIERTVEHLKNVAMLMKENISDCGMVLIVVGKYIESNKIDIENAIAAGDQAQSRMSEQEKKMLALRAKELFDPIMQDVGSVSAEFAKKCGSDVKRLSELLKNLDGQASGL